MALLRQLCGSLLATSRRRSAASRQPRYFHLLIALPRRLVRSRPMAERSDRSNPPSLVARSRRDGALDEALQRLAPGSSPGRPDTPDLHVTALRRLPPVPAQYAPFPEELDRRLRDALAVARHHAALYPPGASRSITRSPAATSWSSRRPHRARRSATTRRCCTRSCRTPASRALYLFPTKALAQDQLVELQTMCETLAAPSGSGRRSGDQIGVFTYDGDTPQDARRTIRARAHLVLSNPDMLHSGILPHHPRWAKLFENLRYVVIDELHAYRGVFGSHLCNVLRRLRRVCRHYGSDPVFICSSATIANPRELAERLAERPFELVAESGAPRGEKFFVFVNPPIVNHQLGIRRSYLGETRRIAAEFLKRHLQLIVFAQSRLVDRDSDDVPEGRFRGRARRAGAHPRLSRRISAEPSPRDREGAARGRGAGRRVHQRPGARHRHRRAGCQRDGRLSGHDCRHVAARGARGPAREPVRRGDGGQQRAARSVHRSQPVVFLRRIARTRAHRSGQPAHPGRSHQVRGVRDAVQHHRGIRPARPAGDTGAPRRAGAGPSHRTGRRSRRPGRREPVDVDQRVLSGRRGQPAIDLVGQLRHRRYDARDAGHRRDGFHERPRHASSEGDLHRRRAAVSGGAPRLRRAQGVRARDRLRLLHRPRSPIRE